MNVLCMLTKNKEALNQIYNCAVGERTNLLELVDYLKKYLSDFDKKINDIEAVHGPFREGDIPHSLASIEKASVYLNYKPTHNIQEGLKSCVSWYLNDFKKRKMNKILITGGAGFIGSHFNRLFVNKYPDYHIFNLDSLTYAGNLENLKDIESNSNYTFLYGDITDEIYVKSIFEKHKFEYVIHLAAESHVDRSIKNPLSFAKPIS